MVWKVFDFDQSHTIQGSVALSKYGDGACLALAMKWCASKKKRISSLHYVRLVATEAQKLTIANWMNQVQDSVLGDLFGNKKFVYYQGKDPITSAGSAKGQINNLKAYAFRLEQMSNWARSEGLVLADDRVGFPAGSGGWIPAMIDAALRQTAPPIIGLISLTGADEGHALGYQYTRDGYDRINFFDPNEGEYRSTSVLEFSTWLTQFLQRNYADLNHQWWVLKFR